ncbi:MAG TPA: hypothetical protein VNZ05_04080 [Solirubrobacteraceae bacterium]|jgi:hypothetical protein|nr:hypothetical protein [Solirubrobacteraceae bacterium]
MTGIWIAVAAAVALTAGAVLVVARRSGRVAEAVIVDPPDQSEREQRDGPVRSVQAADIFLGARELEAIWTPMHLERLARTYWRFLTRVTLGLIRVYYTDRERFVVLLVRPLKLLTFQAPEYEIDALRGLVRWRIARGLLVARRGRGRGYLQIEVRRDPHERSGRARLHVRVEVANFYPAIAFGISRRIYDATQSHIHVLVTHGFLRSLARLDLAESRVRRLVPDDALP